ncbi:nucleotidyl transferase AbiEii/AbiGii toxin family protein [Clostridiaceae bacterium UIB06]|uniref:Nucleotidyl transferase AbiEii/AbiGii toxin family protein n=1 Tax=Clostridium thailandense TaxID=2794346 RepID=A0A949TWT4_9CLOT|nr:nucleotidyl transferase AbiEii/AbiGii toxin family protein [Clostridium thailandense]MBV7276702.1 nucleotidyl transferase AbiEii/AbiGii toxin family protein [Clostridium thailandense]MCH5135634.1 nucleotidyl transferase AbiEii/AbiGii toxin family protein [Clostridiaceae bacterium UIB06]
MPRRIFENNWEIIENIKRIINNIISPTNINDFISFEVKGFEPIAEQREYNGIRVNMIGHISNTKTPFSIDLGVGDVVVPPPTRMELPILIDEFERPNVLTYSLETTIAEKFDAIITRMELSSRMKDFFDIYYLANTVDFDGRKLQEAMFETLQNRHTVYEQNSLSRVFNLINDKDMVKRWKSFCKKILRFDLEFENVLADIIKFLEVPYNAILAEEENFEFWNYKEKKYEKRI